MSLATACVGTAVWLLTGPGSPAKRARPLLAEGIAHTPPGKGAFARARESCRGALPSVARRAGHEWWCVVAGGAVGLVGQSVLPLVAGALAVPLVRRHLRTRRARRTAEERQIAVIDLCTGVAGELRAGALPEHALLTAGVGGLGTPGTMVLAAARHGGDVPDALRAAGGLPGAAGLRGAAACWQVATDNGAGLADALDRVAAALRAERDQTEELRAHLAGARSTAMLLAMLPLFGILLGSAMGAEPLWVLLHTPAGLALLTVGGFLEWAGLTWVAWIVRLAEGSGSP
ncbi:hypothetical protein AN216_23635 [Streptomyces oceani]|uniref:Type II secretion system protein GspF domain-containing protein n=2 Tax=Streptomyces oceani TaxID=1075402 RepID=A0A1E7JW37_9ACTN|nr:hypothetical protein AN216_23635 [Streptomyces oceani]